MKRRAEYPADWKAISERIRARAGNRCERCGVRNHEYIVRSVDAPENFLYVNQYGEYCETDYTPLRRDVPLEFLAQPKTIRVVLTVHHVGIDKPDGTPGNPDDKSDCRDENLRALCQRCHNCADIAIRQQHRAQTRRKRSAANDILGGAE